MSLIRRFRFLKLLWSSILIASLYESGVLEAAVIDPGDAVVTGFSGTMRQGGQRWLDPQGSAVKIFDLRGTVTAQAQLLTPPVKFAASAGSIGQVFGIALDNASPPNIYLGATSAYGLHIIVPDRNGDGIPEVVAQGQAQASFMPGQFGPGGTAGSIWKIDGMTGQISLFATLRNNGIDNGGAGLGNIVFDPVYYQLYVSDLDSGVIHRLDMNGNELGIFDHGLNGRPNEGMSVIPDDGVVADITRSTFDVFNSDTWGFTDIRRRIWGMALYGGRLYYAVGAGPQIWSVGFNPDGSFASDARIEIRRVPGGMPVSDILFTSDGRMVLAQRGMITGSMNFLKFHIPAGNRVLIYRQTFNGRWILRPGEYAVGFPPPYRNASGGVALSCDGTLWSTGDNLRNTPLLKGFGPLVIHGLQGNDLSLTKPRNVPPWNSRFVDYDDKYGDRRSAGHVGDVEIYRRCFGAGGLYNWGASWPGWIPIIPGWQPPTGWTPPPWWLPGPDLSLIKNDTQCRQDPQRPRSLICTYDITVQNVGSARFNGRLFLRDTVPPGLRLLQPPGGSIRWNCRQPGGVGGVIRCDSAARQILAPGSSVTLRLRLRRLPRFRGNVVKNCANIVRKGDPGANNRDCGWGYPPGPDLEIKKTLDLCFAVPGGTECRYWLDINNIGNQAYRGPLHIRDTLPISAQYLGVLRADSPNWSCIGGRSVECWYWPQTVLPARTGNRWLEIAVFVPAGSPRGLKNCAALSSPEHIGDPNINGNNSDCAPVITSSLPKGPFKPTVNRCPAGWSLQSKNWIPPRGWISRIIGQGKNSVICGRKKPTPPPLLCPRGWRRYPNTAAVPRGWNIQILRRGNSRIVCAKARPVTPPKQPRCGPREQRFYSRSQIPAHWLRRRVSRNGITIWCAKPRRVSPPPSVRCLPGETRFNSRHQIPPYWNWHKVTQNGVTIWCAKPPQLPPPLITCKPGFVWNGNRCVHYPETRCPKSYHWNGHTCVPNPAAHCPSGTYWNGHQCLSDENEPHQPKCRPGSHWNGHRCISNPIIHCPKDTYWNGHRCVSKASHESHRKCRPGSHWNGHRCISNKRVSHGCRHGFHWNGHRCVPLHANHRCPPDTRWNGRECTPLNPDND